MARGPKTNSIVRLRATADKRDFGFEARPTYGDVRSHYAFIPFMEQIATFGSSAARRPANFVGYVVDPLGFDIEALGCDRQPEP